ncbi:MAG: DUF6034 family protein [Eubacteriales bacterium]
MKRILILCVGVIIATLGCAKEPDSVEENTTMTYLEYMASSSTSNQAFLLEDLLIPETYETTYDNDEESIHLEINAEVITPDAQTLSIYRVTAGTYDKNYTDQASDYFIIDDSPTTVMDDQIVYPLSEQIFGEFELTEEIINNATLALEDMGISDLVYTDSTPKYLYLPNNDSEYSMQKIYQLTFMRAYDGVPSVFTRNFTKTNNMYLIDSEIWGDEQVQVLVDEDGILSIDVIEAYENVEIYLADVKLLSFSTIIELMNQMIATQDAEIYLTTEYNSTENMEVTYHVEKIVLGMKKMTDIHGEEGLIAPVWDFQGDVTISDTGSLYSNTYENISILTLNAIDGTVVNSVVEQ